MIGQCMRRNLVIIDSILSNTVENRPRITKNFLADGNPLTGEGYGNHMADPRVKHPPGGFSQGLW